MNFNYMHPADIIVEIMNRIYYRKFTTTSGGNLSIKDENGDVWISPSGIDKGALERDDICRVKPDGTVIGKNRPSVEYPFHISVYKKRPDLKAVLHAHPPALVSFSIARRLPDVDLTPSVHHVCGDLAMADYAVPGSMELGNNISLKFEQGYNIVILENHGVCIGAVDLITAFMMFETLETAARLEINARRLGIPKKLGKGQYNVSDTKFHLDMAEFVPKNHSSEECAARRDMINYIHRSYGQGLFCSSQGTYSVRLPDGSFLITPFGRDRHYLEEQDLVLIREGKRERGKTPSRSVRFHHLMYENHDDVGSVLLAHPPHMMAFAVTSADFDPRTIPESYILLRNVKRAPYGSLYLAPQGVVGLFSANTPMLICENDCILVTGSSLLQAFDRLEVADATAQSLLLSKDLGTVVHISQGEVEEINRVFNLS
jgi:L-fuculose-phosphate aldolase